MKKQYILLIAFISLCPMLFGQTIKLSETTIKHNDAPREAISAKIEPTEKKVKSAWKDYLKDNYNVIVLTTLTLLGCSKDETPQPVIVQQPTSPTTTSGTGDSQQFIVVVQNDFSENPLCDVDSLFNSIKVGGVELVDSLKLNNIPNFVIAGWGFMGANVTTYTLNFNQPNPYQIEIGINSNITSSNAAFMVVGWYDQPISENDLTQPCIGLNTYNVMDIPNSYYWAVTNPCQ
jgi:hypothetical protein